MAGPTGLVGVALLTGRREEATRAELGARFGAPVLEGAHPALSRAVRELRSYFGGRRQAFTLPLDLRGTPFQRRVWQALRRVPYGATVTYQELAERSGHPQATRAVANACARNPMPIIIPCHRVVAQDGSLAGYRGGLAAKRRLLALERADAADLPLFRVVEDDPAGAEPESTDLLPEGLHRWLSGHPRARHMTAERWLTEALEVVPPPLWPTLAGRVLDSGRPEATRVVEELLEAWVAELHEQLPDFRELGRFVEVAARAGSLTFEVVGRRLAEIDRLPGPIRDALDHQYQRLMAGDLPCPTLFRERAVDYWLALDPERHQAILAAAARGALGGDTFSGDKG